MIVQRPVFSIHLLEINAGGYSSEHRHERKLNHFYVIRGTLEIRQWPPNLQGVWPPDVTVLNAGDSMTVPIGVWHQFHAPVECVCLETYESSPIEDDIERRTHGGVMTEQNVAGLP